MNRLAAVVLCWALALASPAFAQQTTTVAPALAGQYEYALLIAVNGNNAFLDYGQLKDLGKQAPTTELEKDDAAVRALNRAVLALNYLSGRGWECLGLSSRQRSSGSTSSGSFAIYSATEYLLRRRR